MSLVTINEAKNLRYGFDVEGTIKCMTRPKYVNKKNGDVACVSNAQLADGFGHMIKVSIWNDDIKKVRNNLKIRIKNAYTKIFQGNVILYRSKNGSIDALDFNPDKIFDDMEKFQRCHKDITSVDQYYDYVKSSKSDIYLGAKKSDYLEIIDAFLTIQYARKQQTKGNKAELAAIHYLHQIVTLSPVRIRQTLGLFGIDINIERILRLSNKWDEQRFMLNFPSISHKVTHKIDEKDGDEIVHAEFSIDELPEEIAIEEKSREVDSERPLCEGNYLEFYRKYKGYINYYSNPW